MPEQQKMPDLPSSKAVLQVMNGYRNLSPDEKKQFIDLINKYIKAEQAEKRVLEEAFMKTAASTGPLGGDVCRCCGR